VNLERNNYSNRDSQSLSLPVKQCQFRLRLRGLPTFLNCLHITSTTAATTTTATAATTIDGNKGTVL